MTMSEFDRRLERHQEELRALFFSLYPDREDAYEYSQMIHSLTITY